MLYAIKLNGEIKVGVTTDDVIPPFEMILDTRYTSRDAADKARKRIIDSKVSSRSNINVNVVEVVA